MRRRTGSIGQRLLAAGATALLLAAGLAACSTSDQSHLLRIGVSAPIDSLNPFVSSSDYSSVVYTYVYPHLVQYDTSSSSLPIRPSFATSWQESSDHETWTFHTQAEQKWSDGKTLDAHDAAFTLTMMVKYKDGPTGIMAGFINHLVTATAENATTLVLHYDAPVSNVLAQLTQVDVLPQHVWGKLATGSGKGITSFQNGAPMVSGGPFRLTKYQKNQLALFDVNPEWTGKKPWITGFGIQMFANNDAMVTALKTGQVDMIGESTPATAVASLKKSGMVVSSAAGTGFYDFIINTNKDKKEHRELLDPTVREAFDYAMDRRQMVSTAWLGNATPGSTIVAPGSGWHDDAASAPPFDLAKANALLDGLGFAKGSDGIRVADGHPMAYNVIFPTEIEGAGDRMFQIIQNDFAQIGVKLTMQKMDTDAATTAINGDDNKYTGFDLAMWDWIPPVDPDFVLSVLTCGQLGNNSDSGYCDKDYDALYEQQGVASTESARRAIVDTMQEKILQDRPYLVLVYQNVIEAHSPKWTGFLLSPLVGSVNNLSTQTLLGVHRR